VAVSVEHRALHRAIEDLRTAETSLRASYGDISAVARLRNDLERLVLDVADVDALPPAPLTDRPVAGEPVPATEAGPVDNDSYVAADWDDVDDEGVGGFRGGAAHSSSGGSAGRARGEQRR
jgi:hypothetical protein